MLNPTGLQKSIDLLVEKAITLKPTKIVAIESRGFIFGAPMACAMECGLVLARKRGKLPGATTEIVYDLEYGQDCLQIHVDAIQPNDRCLIIDDLLATGGTAKATIDLVESMGATVVGCSFVINLPEIGGQKKLSAYPLHWLMEFEGH
jgi:adenine phosphoribosyltransferase